MPTYFELFDLLPQFRINLESLTKKLIERQQQAAAQNNLQLKDQLNQAFHILSVDDSRAAYLLELNKQAQQLDQSIADTDFLQSALELREEIDEAISEENLKNIRTEVSDWLMALSNEFAIDFEAQDWSDARDTVRKMRFMQKIIVDITRRIDQLNEQVFDEEFEDDLF